MSRIDKFLWSVRIYKTRSDATEACKNGRVIVNSQGAKASKEVKIGDKLEVRKGNIRYTFTIRELLNSRVSASLVLNYVENTTPKEELEKLNKPKESISFYRERGSGRPTKKERRDIDDLIENLFIDDEE